MQTGAANHKRVQAMGGAKNHGIVLPDADMDQTDRRSDRRRLRLGRRALHGHARSSVPVGQEDGRCELRDQCSPNESPSCGSDISLRRPTPTTGPWSRGRHKERVEGYIQQGVEDGATLIADGRGFTVRGTRRRVIYLGPTLFDNVTPEMESYKEEIFGPVLQIVRAASFEEALSLPSKHQYGNGVAIFTQNGRAARDFAARVNVGMVGINVPIPVPVAYHTFGGWKRSAFGDTNQHGMEGVKFWTKVKTITARWPDSELEHADSSFVIPTMA
jgi:malonate-semialdehyde dehydrogenase (acetylating)/methylmalonate-semialdehyde dehydrogenase